MKKYDEAIAELKKLLDDAQNNKSEKYKKDNIVFSSDWYGYIQGIKSAIYRLEMNNK